ncbi:MAG TPA: hypothetical protein VFU14_15645 [Acidimicrobiales bacterium]|nr:hypothetical protein [Acidimicrobiales bacterium]
MRLSRRAAVAVASAALLTPALLAAAPAPAATPEAFVLNGEGNNLWVYDADDPSRHRILIHAAAGSEDGTGGGAEDGLDINAEICALTHGDAPYVPEGETWFVAGEDTGQNTDDIIRQGWGVFRLDGRDLDSMSATEVGKLVPDSFQTEGDNAENYGCGVLPDGRLVTTDVGDQLFDAPATGQLIVWFPSAEHFGGPIDPAQDRTVFERIPHCKIDIAIATAGGVEVEEIPGSRGDAWVFVASNRPAVDDPSDVAPGGIYRYSTADWPTSEAECENEERLVDQDRAGKSLFIPQGPLTFTPSDIVHSGRGTYYVSSVFTGQVAEFDRTGTFLRYVAGPPVGGVAVPAPVGQLASFTPFGIGVTPDGSLWIADMGIQGVAPASGEGEVYVVRFDDAGNPSAPVSVNDGLDFPDGIGVVVLADPVEPAAGGDSGCEHPGVGVRSVCPGSQRP